MNTAKTATLAAIAAAALGANPKPADATLITPIIGQDGMGLLLQNNDQFNWQTIDLDFQDGYSADMVISLPANISYDGRSGNVLSYTANPNIPNFGPFANVQGGIDYTGVLANIDFTQFTADPDIFGTLEVTIWDAGRTQSETTQTFYPKPDVTLYSDPSAQEPCAGMDPRYCKPSARIPEPTTLALGLIGLVGFGFARYKKE